MRHQSPGYDNFFNPDAVPRPSNGHGICTFADCPNREERIHPVPACGGAYENYCPFGARRMDFSYCHHPKIDATSSEHPGEWFLGFCEVAVREGVCPRGFTR